MKEGRNVTNDFIALMLEHGDFKDKVEVLVEECVGVFGGTSTTIVSSTCNFLHFTKLYP